MHEQQGNTIAVVGAGVAGIVAAYLLSRKHNVTLFEKNSMLGGHTRTITLESGADEGTAIDTGFIVFNDRTYPNFTRFLKQLHVESRNSDMSFSYYNEKTGFQYAGTTLNGLFAQRRNVIRPTFYRMLSNIFYFNQRALRDEQEGKLHGLTLGEYPQKIKLSQDCLQQYLLPMGAAIWSSPLHQILDYPIQSFVSFFKNHGLLALSNRPQWKTVVGGSHSYVKAFSKQFNGTIHTNADIQHIRRGIEKVVLRMGDGREESYDHVVIATHADEALKLLADSSPEEHRLLGAWRYSTNHTVLHTDVSVLPSLRRAWASWNYVEEKGNTGEIPVSVTYHMNRLQGLQTKGQYCVTLNRTKPIPKEHIIREIYYTHPIYTYESITTQAQLPSLNGKQRTYFCGSYFNHGFHEDAVRSAVEVAKKFGLSL